jgi:F-type H+-transporting ATPase subunit delta
MAAEAGIVDKVEKDMQDLAAMLAGSDDLKILVGNPLMGAERQQDALLSIAEKAKFQQLTGNFLGVVAGNRRLGLLPVIIGGFQEELRRRRGEVVARVETALPLSKAQAEALKKQLSETTGASVSLDVSVNKDLLGGMVVTVGSRMIDDSVRRKLERLQRAMSAGANGNPEGLRDAV